MPSSSTSNSDKLIESLLARLGVKVIQEMREELQSILNIRPNQDIENNSTPTPDVSISTTSSTTSTITNISAIQTWNSQNNESTTTPISISTPTTTSGPIFTPLNSSQVCSQQFRRNAIIQDASTTNSVLTVEGIEIPTVQYDHIKYSYKKYVDIHTGRSQREKVQSVPVKLPQNWILVVIVIVLMTQIIQVKMMMTHLEEQTFIVLLHNIRLHLMRM